MSFIRTQTRRCSRTCTNASTHMHKYTHARMHAQTLHARTLPPGHPCRRLHPHPYQQQHACGTHACMHAKQMQNHTQIDARIHHTGIHTSYRHLHTCRSEHTHKHTHTHIRARTHTYTHTHTVPCTHTRSHTHTHTRTHAHTHTFRRTHGYPDGTQPHSKARMRAHTHIPCAHTIGTHIFLHACKRMRMHMPARAHKKLQTTPAIACLMEGKSLANTLGKVF